ncbi:hypothetical protein PUN28_004268 [Cardiocondyla obscurior]|uniref:Uncharacterized protein n=1 Tax=Cardiocondyla obscurior TaxID=286306 RepID=A0AAW2GBV2_9HYME
MDKNSERGKNRRTNVGVDKRDRKKLGEGEEGIEIKKWKTYFGRILGGVEQRVAKGRREEKTEGVEKKIKKEEIARALRRLKNGKAIGGDTIPGKVWKYGEQKVKKWVSGYVIRYEKERNRYRNGKKQLR